MKNVIRAGIAVLFGSLLGACSSVPVEQGPPPAVQEFVDSKSDLFGVGDELAVQVWRLSLIHI